MQRPIPKLVAAYSLADVTLLHEMHEILISILSHETIKKMDEYSAKSTQETFEGWYQATGWQIALIPFKS